MRLMTLSMQARRSNNAFCVVRAVSGARMLYRMVRKAYLDLGLACFDLREVEDVVEQREEGLC